MSSLVIIPSIFILLLLVIVMAYLIYLCVVYRAKIDNLLVEAGVRKIEIKSLKNHINSLTEYMSNKDKNRKLYTYDSACVRVEDVVLWRVVDQHIELTLRDGSLYVVKAPSQYKFIIQEQSEEEPSE